MEAAPFILIVYLKLNPKIIDFDVTTGAGQGLHMSAPTGSGRIFVLQFERLMQPLAIPSQYFRKMFFDLFWLIFSCIDPEANCP